MSVKVVYVGPGTGHNERTMLVSENEVDDLVKTGLWDKVTSKRSSSDQPKPPETAGDETEEGKDS